MSIIIFNLQDNRAVFLISIALLNFSLALPRNLVLRKFLSYESYYFYSAFICSVSNIKATNYIQM